VFPELGRMVAATRVRGSDSNSWDLELYDPDQQQQQFVAKVYFLFLYRYIHIYNKS